jgi:hypothetical protein
VATNGQNCVDVGPVFQQEHRQGCRLVESNSF